MSGISGRCTESPSRVLFDQGVEKLQNAKLEKDSIEAEPNNQAVSGSGTENKPSITEGLKGSLFDGFA